MLSVCTRLQCEPNVQQYTFCRMDYEELKLMNSKNFDKKRCHTVIASARHLLPLPSLHNWGWCYISSAKLGLLGQAWRHVHHHVTVIYMAAKFLLTGCFWQEKVSTYCHRCSEGFILIKKEKRGVVKWGGGRLDQMVMHDTEMHICGWFLVSSAILDFLGLVWKHVHRHVTVIYMARKFLFTQAFLTRDALLP